MYLALTKSDNSMEELRGNDNGAAFVAPSYKELEIAIAAEGTASTEIDMRGYKTLTFQMPAAWTAATLTPKGSLTAAGTKQTITKDGTAVGAITVAADGVYEVSTLSGQAYVTLVSSAAQEAARTIKVILKG